MHWRRGILASTVVLASFAGACSWFIDLPSTRTDIPPVDDGGASDVTELDVFEYVDPDAEPLPPPVPFCPTQGPSIFCEDFDEHPPRALTNLGAVSATGGELSIVNAVSLSPPRAVVATVSQDTGTALVRLFAAMPPRHVTLGASILVSTFTASDIGLMQLELVENATDAGTKRCYARLTATTTWAVTQLCTDGGVETARTVLDTQRAVPRRRWQRFALRVTELAKITLHIDDELVADVAPLDPATLRPATAAFGVEHATGGTVAVFYDDLLVTDP